MSRRDAIAPCSEMEAAAVYRLRDDAARSCDLKETLLEYKAPSELRVWCHMRGTRPYWFRHPDRCTCSSGIVCCVLRREQVGDEI